MSGHSRTPNSTHTQIAAWWYLLSLHFVWEIDSGTLLADLCHLDLLRLAGVTPHIMIVVETSWEAWEPTEESPLGNLIIDHVWPWNFQMWLVSSFVKVGHSMAAFSLPLATCKGGDNWLCLESMPSRWHPFQWDDEKFTLAVGNVTPGV